MTSEHLLSANLTTREYVFEMQNTKISAFTVSRFGGLPRELYFPKGLYFPKVRSTEGKYCPEGKYNYLGITDT